jgi:FkbM family methyltransferase
LIQHQHNDNVLNYEKIKDKDGYQYYVFKQDGSSDFTFVDEEIVRINMYYPFLQAGTKVVDIGAGYGSYTLPALQRGCKVIIITPQVPNQEHEKLRMNLSLNHHQFKKDSYKIIDMAVYSDFGFLNPNTRHYAKYQHLMEPAKIPEYVMCAPIDELIRQDRVDFIKMDVEGAEYEALKGAYQTIKKNRPTMLIENHLFHDANIEAQIIQMVLDWGLGYVAGVVPYAMISHTLFTMNKEQLGSQNLVG